MPDPNAAPVDQHAHHVEAEILAGPAVAGYPDAGRPTQLLLFPPVDRSHGIAEPVSPPRLDLDEGSDSAPLDDQVDVTVAAPEAASYHPPPP